jgi:hypothetical protein
MSDLLASYGGQSVLEQKVLRTVVVQALDSRFKCYACQNIPEGHGICSGHPRAVSHPECLCACVLYCSVPPRDAHQYLGV